MWHWILKTKKQKFKKKFSTDLEDMINNEKKAYMKWQSDRKAES
jgi:hypothetical protein